MRLLSPADAVISHVITLKAEAAPAEGEAKAAEPEVIKKGKKEEAAAEGDKGKAPAAKAPAAKKK
jgi:large subunit ribosomal protein L25